ncbi:hypothetical protein B188_00280 [Candidatus Brocadiaceae bacterium B188]|nr:hypothetical protein B188_00280 [Candidatus Brocadiaceae bacterium B188]
MDPNVVENFKSRAKQKKEPLVWLQGSRIRFRLLDPRENRTITIEEIKPPRK